MTRIKSIVLIAVAMLAGATTSTVARAEDLDARLEALERENAALKKRVRIEALERENATLRKKLNYAAPSDQKLSYSQPALGAPEQAKPASALAYAPHASAYKEPPPVGPIYVATPMQWSGIYFGTTVGAAWTRSHLVSNERYISSFPGNPPPFNVNGNSILAVGAGHGMGAELDVLLGANLALGPRFLVGAQVEGTIADLNFNSSGTRAYSYFDGAGPVPFSAVGDFRPHVHARWMTSALLRAGALLDPATLLYAIGGWTGARFDYQNLTNNTFFAPTELFWANGFSIGGGLERKLDPNWSLRAEYRYTQFGTMDVSNLFSFITNTGSSQTNSIQSSFLNAMQVGRIGIAYAVPPAW